MKIFVDENIPLMTVTRCVIRGMRLLIFVGQKIRE